MHCCLSQLSFQASIAELLRGLLKHSPIDTVFAVFAAVVWSLIQHFCWHRSGHRKTSGKVAAVSAAHLQGLEALGVERESRPDCDPFPWPLRWMMNHLPKTLIILWLEAGGQISFSFRSLWEVNHGLMKWLVFLHMWWGYLQLRRHSFSYQDFLSSKSFRCELVCLSLITPWLPGFCVAQSRPWLFLPGKLGSLREDCREQRKDEAATTCCAVKIEAGIWGSDCGCGLCHETTPWLLVIDTHGWSLGKVDVLIRTIQAFCFGRCT